MTRPEAIRLIHAHLRTQFPKRCNCCGRVYRTLGDYFELTSSLGDPVVYDAQMGDWMPSVPIGSMAYSNCPCGSTLVVTTEGMKRWTLWRLLAWVREETRERNIEPSELLIEIKEDIRHLAAGRPSPAVLPRSRVLR